MGRIRSYRDNSTLAPLLDSLPKRKQGEITRKALYDYFFKSNNQTTNDVTPIQSIPLKTKETKIELSPVKEFKFNMFEDDD